MQRPRVIFAFRLLMVIGLAGACAASAQPGKAALRLPIPAAYDLAHVEAMHYAAALGRDPTRIFEFVRDQIGHEIYTGALRGPRGTLLAMAGNSVDRAALLASLLKESGHRVQFVKGTLPGAEARKLVDSMWTARPRPAKAEMEGEPPLALKLAFDTVEASVKRDYALIGDHLRKANIVPAPQSAPSIDLLVQEAQEHYWVQWWKDNAWVDLDPSFADAIPGRRYTSTAVSSLDSLPDALFHRIAIRIRLEEYTGDQPSGREILAYAAKAADLSGADIVLSHQPENWTGPATSLSSALASAIGETGRVKPVLIIGAQPVMGEAFRQRAPTGAGIGGIKDLLSGAGTRRPVPIATAEIIEFELIYPGGRKTTVAREIFDVVGRAHRSEAAGRGLSADEIRTRTEARDRLDVTEAVYSLFVTTGRIDAAHLKGAGREPAGDDAHEARSTLQAINIGFTVTSDAVLARHGEPDRAVTLFYPDSPRIYIAEISSRGGVPRLSLDLRRDYARAVANKPQPEIIFSAQVLRGTVNGAIERTLMEFITAEAHKIGPDWRPVLSTSSLFERAHATGVASELVSGANAAIALRMERNVHARLNKELSDGYLVIVPKQTISVGKEERLAWWRINPRTGETTPVTDEGLHQAAVCYTREQRSVDGRVQTIVRIHYRRPWGSPLTEVPRTRTITWIQDGTLRTAVRIERFLRRLETIHRIPPG